MKAAGKLWRPVCFGKRLTLFIVIFAFLSLTLPALAGEFNLVKIGPDYEPESYEHVELPGEMKAGIFSYILKFSDKKTTENTLKAGIVKGGTIYYVDSEINTKTEAPSKESEYSGEFDPGGDTNFGLYRNFLFMDSWAYGTSHNRRMYLFKFSKEKIELLDVIVNAGIKDDIHMDFVSVLYGNRTRGAGRTSINDLDHNGNPEIAVEILRGHPSDNDFLDKIFVLYFEVKNGHLAVNLNPVLYQPLFEKAAHTYKTQKRPDPYYMYGFLAGALTLQEIKDVLASDQNQYMRVVTLLADKDKWNEAFHEYNGEKPVLIKYEYK